MNSSNKKATMGMAHYLKKFWKANFLANLFDQILSDQTQIPSKNHGLYHIFRYSQIQTLPAY